MRSRSTFVTFPLLAAALCAQQPSLAEARRLAEAKAWTSLAALAEQGMQREPHSLDWCYHACLAYRRIDRHDQADALLVALRERIALLDRPARPGGGVARSRGPGDHGTGRDPSAASTPSVTSKANEPATNRPGTTPVASDPSAAATDASGDKDAPRPPLLADSLGDDYPFFDGNDEQKQKGREQVERKVAVAPLSQVLALDPETVPPSAREAVKSALARRLQRELSQLVVGFGERLSAGDAARDALIVTLEAIVAAMERSDAVASEPFLTLLQDRQVLQVRQASARVLRACGRALERWATAIDLRPEERERLAYRSTLTSATKVHAAGPTQVRELLEGLLFKLRASRSTEVSQPAETELAAFAQARLASGREAEQNERRERAALDYEVAQQCDPALVDSLAKAADLFVASGRRAGAVRAWKRLRSASRAGALATLATEKLEGEQAAAVVRLKGDVTQLYRTNDWQAVVRFIRAELPILAGPELRQIEDMVQRGASNEALKELNGLVDRIKKGTLVEKMAIVRGHRMGVEGDLLVVPSVAMKMRPATDGGEEIYISTAPIDETFWSRLRAAPIFSYENSTGPRCLSYPNSENLCELLNEREADRLPVGMHFRIPTSAELARFRDKNGKLPYTEVDRLWVSDPCAFGGTRQFAMRWRIGVDDSKMERIKAWQHNVEPPTGVVFVLARR
ncbi:MAG: hypothetical protein ACE37K_16605 [Planctomycetota bacterium]